MKSSISPRHGVLPAVVATLCLGAAAPAGALTLDPTAFIELTGVTGPDNITVNMNGASDLLAGSVTNTQTTPFGGTGTVTATTSNVQPLFVKVNTPLVGGKSGGGTARIEFRFAIDGPDPGGGFRLPVDITSSGAVTLDQGQGSGAFGGAAGQVSARFEIYEGASFVGNWVASKSCSFDSSVPGNCSSNTGESFDFMVTRDLLPNFIYEGIMEVAIHGQGGGAGYFVDAWGYVDPIITINPLFPDIGDYDLVFSPGTVPAGQSIPEPATLALFGTGLVAIAWRARRRRTG